MFVAKIFKSILLKKSIELITDFNNDIILEIQNNGLNLQSMDKYNVVLFSLYLSSINFEEYRCDKNILLLCFSAINFSKIMKFGENDDLITLSVDGESSLNIKFKNISKNIF